MTPFAVIRNSVISFCRCKSRGCSIRLHAYSAIRIYTKDVS